MDQGLPHSRGLAGMHSCSCRKGWDPADVSFCSNTAHILCRHERAPGAASQTDRGKPNSRPPTRRSSAGVSWPCWGPRRAAPQQTPPSTSLGCGLFARPVCLSCFCRARSPKSLAAGGKGGAGQAQPGTCAPRFSALLLMRNEGTPSGLVTGQKPGSAQGPSLQLAASDPSLLVTFCHGVAHFSSGELPWAHENRQEHVMSCTLPAPASPESTASREGTGIPWVPGPLAA